MLNRDSCDPVPLSLSGRGYVFFLSHFEMNEREKEKYNKDVCVYRSFRNGEFMVLLLVSMTMRPLINKVGLVAWVTKNVLICRSVQKCTGAVGARW